MVVVQPEKARRKTDRRDAARLNELLWINREWLLSGRKVNGLRVVEMPNEVDAETGRRRRGGCSWDSSGRR